MMGYIHSIETFGTVDGPGVRFVVFFQGCPMRCRYCHNPDTWEQEAGTKMTVAEILERLERNRSFYTTGGITATGGEPMQQIEFLIELFEAARERKIHTCLDTSGVFFPADGKEMGQVSMEKVNRLLAVTDLVMLDIKHILPEEHRKLTGFSNRASLQMAEYLDKLHKPVWVRHVVVPGITYEKEELTRLGEFLGTLSNVEKVEALPYHAMGKVKYDALGIDYSLEDVRQLTKTEAKEAHEMILEAMQAAKRRLT